MKRAVLIVAGIILLGGIALWAVFGNRHGTSITTSDSPAPIPENQIRSVRASDLAFTIEHPTVSPAKKLLFATHRRTALAMADPDGKNLELITPQRFRSLESVAWADDGSRAVLEDADGSIFLFSAADRSVTPLPKGISNADWSPDGSRFAYLYESRVVQVRTVASGTFETVGEFDRVGGFSWSPDGTRLAVYGPSPDGGLLHIINLISREVTDTSQSAVTAAFWLSDSQMLITEVAGGAPRTHRFSLGESSATELVGPDVATSGIRIGRGGSLVTGPDGVSSDYYSSGGLAADSLWMVTGEGSTELTTFDRRVRAIKYVEPLAYVITDSRVYQVEYSPR